MKTNYRGIPFNFYYIPVTLMDKQSASPKEDVYRSLRSRIITQDLKPGQVLNEKALMEYYNIGRTPMREILLQLKNDCLVQIIPRSGTLVAPLDLQELKQVIEVRTTLEGLAGELAAERITDAQLDRLRDIMDDVDNQLASGEIDFIKLFECESDFHGVIYEAAVNQKLMEMLQELQGVCARFWHYLVFGEKELLAQIEDQRKMLVALAAHDTKQARKIMRTHIINFSNQVKENILDL
jgi:DNA-binding GntR family transcriptional regulator